MARTSRNGAQAASVDALDHINLDDMFADDGDALFDGLDIDLGSMDEIAESTSSVTTSKIAVSSAILPLHTAASSSANQAGSSHDNNNDLGVGKRRVTKRKIKSTMFFEDEDDDYIDQASKKKKKRNAPSSSKAPNPKTSVAGLDNKKKGDSIKNSSEVVTMSASATVADGKKTKNAILITSKKNQKSAGILPLTGRTGTGVAAAGQFGNRPKKGGGSSFSLPLASKFKSSPLPSRAALSSPSISGMSSVSLSQADQPTKGSIQTGKSDTRSPSLAHVLAMHPVLQQGLFCGIRPSDTLFYPFMPGLPAEPTLKHRKVFPMMDRIHSFFLSHATSSKTNRETSSSMAQVEEAILQLMQDTFREEKPCSRDDPVYVERSKSIRNAISATRKSIEESDKSQLTGDLLALCALLNKQHDFLKQNSKNMEHWCKDHLSDADFVSIYPLTTTSKRQNSIVESRNAFTKPSLLASFNVTEIKVKIVCSNFKAPKSGPTIATLPSRIAAVAVTSAVVAPLPSTKSPAKSKKRKLPSSDPLPITAGDQVKALSSVAAVASRPAETISYAKMNTIKRRRAISDQVSRIARDLESKHLSRFDEQRIAIEQRSSELRILVQDDPVLSAHTLGMWKWLEKTGYCSRLTHAEISWRLDVGASSCTQTQLSTASIHSPILFPEIANETSISAVIIDRLQSLLVEQGDDDVEDCLGDKCYEHLHDFTAQDLPVPSCDMVPWSVVNSLGLCPSVLTSFDVKLDNLNPGLVPGVLMKENATEDEIGSVINSMIDDLNQRNDVSNRRLAYLKSIAEAYVLHDTNGKKVEEAAVLAKYQQLLRKAKEAKGKNGKQKVVKKDEYSLPW